MKNIINRSVYIFIYGSTIQDLEQYATFDGNSSTIVAMRLLDDVSVPPGSVEWNPSIVSCI